MTIEIEIKNHDHEDSKKSVKLTIWDRGAEEGDPAAINQKIELKPGQSQRSIYVHSGNFIMVEEEETPSA